MPIDPNKIHLDPEALRTAKLPRKKRADPAPTYTGGKALAEIKTGPAPREATLNLSEFQKAAERRGISVPDLVLDFWEQNRASLVPAEAIKLLNMMLEHTSPKVKPIEGQIQVDGNVTIVMNYLNQPVEEKQVTMVLDVETMKQP